MSSSSLWIIAAVTAILKNLLENELVQQFAHAPIGDVTVTALAPDRIAVSVAEKTQLNLYLYHITPNSGRYFTGTTAANMHSTHASPAPLTLDLHYLLTAYSERELQAEALLGCAMRLFHEKSVLTQEMFQATLASIASTNTGAGRERHPVVEALATSITTDQVQALKIIPEFLNMEEMTKLWNALQAHARLSMAYRISVVFIGDHNEREPQQNSEQAAMR